MMNASAELEESGDAEGNRHPESDQAVDQDRREDRRLGYAEEDEGANHPRVDGAHPGGRERDQVGDHAEEEALDDHGERHVDAEGVEGGPEDADVGGPEAGGAEHGQAALARVGEEADREAEPLSEHR